MAYFLLKRILRTPCKVRVKIFQNSNGIFKMRTKIIRSFVVFYTISTSKTQKECKVKTKKKNFSILRNEVWFLK